MATAKSKRPSGSKPASGKGASREEDSTDPKGYPLKRQREAAQRLIAMGGSAPGTEPVDAEDFQLVPNRSALEPGMDDPRAMKKLLADEDTERYLRTQADVT